MELEHCHSTCFLDPRVTCSGPKVLSRCHCCTRCSSGGPAAATVGCLFCRARLFTAHMGQPEPLSLPAAVLLQMDACQLWGGSCSVQSHQTCLLLFNRKLLGGFVFSVGCHCLQRPGCRARRLLHLQGLRPEHTGQPLPPRQTLATFVVHSWGCPH